VFLSELHYCDVSKVKLLGSLHAEVLHAWVLEEAFFACLHRVLEHLMHALERRQLWDFFVLNNAIVSVGGKASCVTLDPEAERLAVKDLDWVKVVELSHAFDFSKLDVVSVLERVSLIFMDRHVAILILLNS